MKILCAEISCLLQLILLGGAAKGALFEARISQGTDDAEEAIDNGEVFLSSSDLELTEDEWEGTQIVGIRFQGMSVPQGAVITAALIEFKVDETTSTSTSLTLRGQDSDDASTFTATYYDISARPLTTAAVQWNNVPAWNVKDESHESPDVSSLVQEIVNRPGWSAGNAMAFVISGSGQRIAHSYDGAGSSASTLLKIIYNLPPAPPAPPPTAPPPVPSVFESRISISTDDAEEFTDSGEVYLDSSDLELVEDEHQGPQVVGLRFQGVAVPSGAAITNSFIEFTVDETSSVSTSLTFHGQSTDDASTFATTNNNISDRPMTSASVAWNNVPAWNSVGGKHQTPNLSSIVQEIVDRSGWSNGNDMAFIISGSGQRIVESYDGGGSTKSPLLKIEYRNGQQNPTSHPPTHSPTPAPSSAPTRKVTQEPTQTPTRKPTLAPTPSPTQKPTPAPTETPTELPTPASNQLPPTETVIRVSDGKDDAEEAIDNGEVFLSSSDLELTEDEWEGTQIVGIRFQGVSVPQGAVITSALLEFRVDETTSTSTSLTFRGQDSDDASAFAVTYYDISARPVTAAAVQWNNVPAWNVEDASHQSPDVSSLVQEIVDRPGWSAGNAMAFVISGSGQRIAHSYDGDSSLASLLRIEYVPSCSDGVLNGDETGIDCGGYCSPCSSNGDPVPLGQSGNWNLIFSDEFDGSEVDQNKWERGWFSNTGYSRSVNSYEDGCYHPSQLTVSGGSLRITAESYSHPDCKKKDGSPAPYVSGLVNSRLSFTFSYGYTEARVWLPSDSGGLQNWPAVWHTGFDHPATGEIDIMEGLSSRQPCSSYHWGTDDDYNSVTECANMSNPGGWHTFAAKWEPNKITFYYDGQEHFVHTEGVVGSPHYLILNQAVNNNYGIDVPATMLVDYIRVWSLP